MIISLQDLKLCTVGLKSHDPCFHKKYMEEGVMTFVTHCTIGLNKKKSTLESKCRAVSKYDSLLV